jgi:hypothetical protein
MFSLAHTQMWKLVNYFAGERVRAAARTHWRTLRERLRGRRNSRAYKKTDI